MCSRHLSLSFAFIALLFAGGCGQPEVAARDESRAAPPQPATAPAPPSETAGAKKRERPTGTPRIVFLGDSLTAGLGLPETESYPSLIQARLDRDGYDYEVINAGVSGDTSAGALRRVDWAMDGNVKVLVVALGGNDGLRGLPPDDLRRNLSAIIEKGKARGATVVLAGMEAPPNNGPDYTAGFRRVYRELARSYDLAFIPFLLDRVAGDNALNQADGIHPNARGAEILAETVWTGLVPVLSKTTATR